MLTIIIPCYNQPQFLRRSLLSIKEQTFRQFEVIIVDDAGTADYQPVLEEFSDLKITKVTNEVNKGAMHNMVYCLAIPVNTPYKIVFHEDDIMHPYLLESLMLIIESNDDIAAVGTEMFFFKDVYKLQREDFIKPELRFTVYRNRQNLIYDLVNYMPLCFGSFLYRQSVLKSNNLLDLNRYWTLADRPFIIGFIPTHSIAVIHNKLVFYSEHYNNDKRNMMLTTQHVLNFFQYYKKEVGVISVVQNRKIFNSILTKEMIITCRSLTNINKRKFWICIFNGFKRNIISFKYFIFHFYKLWRV